LKDCYEAGLAGIARGSLCLRPANR
jgi:hypothetical protein